MTYIMKRIFCVAAAVVLCTGLLCACGGENKSESSQGSIQASKSAQGASSQAADSTSAVDLSESHLKNALACAWVNKSDYNEKIKFKDDLTFTHFIKADRHSGTATLDEKSGLLTVAYDDEYMPEKSYAWVDSLKNVNADTWYVDGGTFAFGGATFIKDMEI